MSQLLNNKSFHLICCNFPILDGAIRGWQSLINVRQIVHFHYSLLTDTIMLWIAENTVNCLFPYILFTSFLFCDFVFCKKSELIFPFFQILFDYLWSRCLIFLMQIRIYLSHFPILNSAALFSTCGWNNCLMNCILMHCNDLLYCFTLQCTLLFIFCFFIVL